MCRKLTRTVNGRNSTKPLIDNGEVCHALAGEDAKGELERAKGFEPSTLTLAT